ncbi:MAG: NAD(P)H-hydrate epimerase, partial [Treponemataceae bacterium]|nr:NAD(P)H-hydrate epimerase [Treponemataceae bacterium]
MRPLFLDTRVLDKAARERYDLTEELMMENAASALERAVMRHILDVPPKADARTVAVLCGGGNNGADGYALARRLAGQTLADSAWFVPVVIAVAAPKSDLCRRQAARAKKCGVQCLDFDSAANADTVLSGAEIIVDCLFGSGFHGDLDEKTAALCARANAARALRIACDVPTGLREDGTVAEGAFVADCTVTMGALKLSLYG